MEVQQMTGNKMPSQEHLSFINKLNDSKIPRRNQLIANRLFMKNFPRETTGAEIEHCFQTFGAIHDVKIIAKENTHFAFISFVNDNTALEVLRQHAIVPITFQNHPIILAPAYKKNIMPMSTSTSPCYPTNGSTMTPPPTPSRINGMSHQASTSFPQQQHQVSTTQHAYPPIFVPVQANVPFLPMTSTYVLPHVAPPPPQISTSFYPAFYTHGATHPAGGQFINGHTFMQSPYMYSMNLPTIPGQYRMPTSTNDVSLTSEY